MQCKGSTCSTALPPQATVGISGQDRLTARHYIGAPMISHPNFDRAQAALDAARQGDYAPAFDAFTGDILLVNGPGAGPWYRARGKDDVALLLVELSSSLGETFHQDGWCVYADDRVAISLVHETGTAPGGDRFDNVAVYISRLRPDGKTDRLWTVDLDAEHCEAFWEENPGTPSKDFSSQRNAAS